MEKVKEMVNSEKNLKGKKHEEKDEIDEKRRIKKRKRFKIMKVSTDKNLKSFQSVVQLLDPQILPYLKGFGVTKKRVELKMSPIFSI